MTYRVVCVACSLIVLLALPAHAIEFSGSLVEATSEGMHFWDTSLRIDHMDRPHLAYTVADSDGNSVVKYAYQDGTDWSTVTLGEGHDVSLAVDGFGIPHVSYIDYEYVDYDFQRTTLYYGVLNGTSFDVTTLLTGNQVACDPVIALDSAGAPQIVDVNSGVLDIEHRAWNGDSWQFSNVNAPGPGMKPSFAIDANDTPHIAYHDLYPGDNSLEYATRNGTWEVETVERRTGAGAQSWVGITSGGDVHIVYSADDPHSIEHAVRDGTSWDVTRIAEGYDARTGPGTLHAALSTSDEIHLLWSSAVQYPSHFYSKWDGTDWFVEDANVSGPIAFSGTGALHTVYEVSDGDSESLFYGSVAEDTPPHLTDDSPEPATWVLLAATAAFGALRRRRD